MMRCARQLQQWILEHFLEQVCFNLEQRPARLVMVIAGRELPSFEHHWSAEDCGSVVRSVNQMSAWERKHVEECLRVHGFSYTAKIVDRFYWQADLTRAIELQSNHDDDFYWRERLHYRLRSYRLAPDDVFQALIASLRKERT